MTRIKEIKFNKIEKIDIINDKTEKNMTKYIATTDNTREISDFSIDSNKYELKDIDNDIILKNTKSQLNTQNQSHENIKDIAIKRNNTNSELPEKVQILSLQNNINNANKKNKNKSKFGLFKTTRGKTRRMGRL